MKALTIIVMGISLSACGGESEEAVDLAGQFEQAVEELPTVDIEIATDGEVADDLEAVEEAVEEAAEEAAEAMGNAAADFGAMMENLGQDDE